MWLVCAGGNIWTRRKQEWINQVCKWDSMEVGAYLGTGLGFSRPKPVFAVQNGINWDKPVFPSFSRPKLGKTVQIWEKLYFKQQKVSEMWLSNWNWTAYSRGQFDKKLWAHDPNFVKIAFALILILIIYSGLTLPMSHQLCCQAMCKMVTLL